MKNNFIIGFLILLILANGWSIIYLELPFCEINIALAAVSILIMSLLHNRFVFLYAITVILSYGAFLTVYAFVNNQSSEKQMLYIYDHLLLTSFLLLFWILINYVKTISYENVFLKKQLSLLEKFDKKTSILTPHEFIYQAKWILRSAQRNGQAWMIKMTINYEGKYVKENLQEHLETIVLSSMRQQFDLVTAIPDQIYFILKDTDEAGVKIVLDRIEGKLKSELNTITLPYEVTVQHFKDENLLAPIEGEIQ
ncbi:hypothetical protein ACH0BF_21670 [Pseudobacillus sp. 179-B 2D1 NHS]|uniref:hypothetical protein n=1 Tax=Pseudobacillus sp. 179-B 2D1 NHS TaxID=3374292 RepID=UPI003879DB98